MAQLFYNEVDLPCKTMFRALTSFPKIKDNNVAPTLYRGDYMYGGRMLMDRFADRTFLSREIVGAKPGQWPKSVFRSFANSAQDMVSRIVGSDLDPERVSETLEFFLGEASERMVESLEGCGVGTAQYESMVERIRSQGRVKESDKLVAALILFIAAGCTSEVSFAVSQAEGYFKNMLSLEYRTAMEGDNPDIAALRERSELDAFPRLALMRMAGESALKPNVYPLSTAPEGTVIGRFPGEEDGESAITDVEGNVSRRHLRIWRGEDGRWMAEGLGSTNGSTLVAGADGALTVIEPPRSKGASQASSAARILPGDVICLAESTRFLVIALS